MLRDSLLFNEMRATTSLPLLNECLLHAVFTSASRLKPSMIRLLSLLLSLLLPGALPACLGRWLLE